MRNKFGTYILMLAFCGSLAVILNSCKKNDGIVIPNQELVSFGNASTTGAYFITNTSSSVFKIPVGTTVVSNVSRNINFSVSSPSGAVEGQQYTIANKTLTIPAGSSVDTIELKGIFAGYPISGTRKDTLVFKITNSDVAPLAGSDQYTVVLQKYCDVNLASFTGAYTAQDYYNGAPDGGPYDVFMTAGTASGTTGKIAISGLWGYSASFDISLNWTNPASFTTNVATQNWFVHSTYGQSTVKANGSGTFSSCENKFTIGYEVTVAAGSFGKYTTTLVKK